MKILVLGGTQFLGRHIVEAALAAGHTVSVFNRGLSADSLPSSVGRLHGDRNEGLPGLTALDGREWDACVDVSGYTPAQVRASAEALHGRVAQYVYVSAVSVYDHTLSDAKGAAVDEVHPKLPAALDSITTINSDTYGPLKVRCEGIVQSWYPNAFTILRPQIIVGEHDNSHRFSYWVQRAQRSGADTPPMLAPGDGTDFLQVIDVHDVAAFTLNVMVHKRVGCFNLAGQRVTWSAFMHMLNAKNFVWVDAEILQQANLTFSELPFYRANGGARCSLMHVNSGAAKAAGLVLTPLEGSIASVAAAPMHDDEIRTLTPEREAELIAEQLAGDM